MREPRNPFRIRSAEAIEFEPTFLRLFGPGVLEVIPPDKAWNRTLIFSSAPGGGKTSLFRLFTPLSLLSLYDYRSYDDYKELFGYLKSLDAISEDGPLVLGIMLSCARNYADLEDLAFDKLQRTRLFFSLLNSRITLAMLRNALILVKLDYPRDLSRIEIQRPSGVDIPSTIPVPCSGKVLYDWASTLERNVCSAIDSFGPPAGDSLVGHETLYSLFLLRPECILFKGSPIGKRSLLLLDDVHKLTKTQRIKLLNSLVELRPPAGVWLAERLEATEPEDLLGSGATEGREYDKIFLETFWREEGRSRRFEKVLASIADRRTKLVTDFEVGPFASLFQGTLDNLEWDQRFRQFGETVATRVRNRASLDKSYDEWVKLCETAEGTPRERSIKWRSLEILIERDSQRVQQRLFDIPLSNQDLKDQEGSDVRESAELFLCKEFAYPYYFGFPKLAKLSSSNIEQFLEIAGDLFEEITALNLLKLSLIVNAERQEDILRKIAKRKWDSISSVPEGQEIKLLLESVGELCRSETFRPTSPYAPGATGFAITMADREILINPVSQQRKPELLRLAEVLSASISNNLLEVYLDKSQGQRGNRWMILYMNRLLCLYFGLPMQYGGWRPLNLDKLCKFVRLPKPEVNVTLE